MERLPGWGISSMPELPSRQHEHERRHTPFTHLFILTRWVWKNHYDGRMTFGDLVGLKLPDICLRPAADESSKAAFGKSASAKTCFLLLKIRLAHINRAKSKNGFEHVLARCSRKHLLVARAKTCSKVLLLFARLVCASHIFNKRKHVRACFSKSAFAKSSFARLVCARP